MLRLIDVNQLLGHLNINFYCAIGGETPKYVVACWVRGNPVEDIHWAREEDEITYETCNQFEYQNLRPGQQLAFGKLLSAGKIAKGLGCDYIWVDHCCIDQSDPEDVTRSINLRCQWYAQAETCLVYLPDSQPNPNLHERLHINGYRTPCKWLFQSWSVPAILESKQLNFYGKNWLPIGKYRKQRSLGPHSINALKQKIQKITSIAPEALFKLVSLSEYSVATRLSWAEGPTEPEREEDLAYSLVGIFGVRITPNYGEGGKAAFYRLAAEIMRSTSDMSILAWEDSEAYQGDTCCGALPSSPIWYLYYTDIPRMPSRYPLLMTRHGVQVTALLYPIGLRYFMCFEDQDNDGMARGIYLRRIDHHIYQREESRLSQVKVSELLSPGMSTFYITLSDEPHPPIQLKYEDFQTFES